MESDTSIRLSLLAKALSDAFTLDLKPFSNVFDTTATSPYTEMEARFGTIETAWADLIALSQHFQTGFLPNDLNIVRTDETESETPKSQKMFSKEPIQKRSPFDFTETFFPMTESRKSDPSDFQTSNQTDSQTSNQTNFQTADASNLKVFESNQSNSADDAAAIWHKPLGNLGNLSTLTNLQQDSKPVEVTDATHFNATIKEDSKAIWQKPLGNLGNLSTLTDFETDSADWKPTDWTLFEDAPQKTTLEQKTLESLDRFTDLTEIPFEATVFPTTHPENKDFPIETNHAVKKMDDWLPKLQQPIRFENQASVQNTLPSDDSTINHAFLPKADEDITAQTDAVLEALTQRIVQEFNRFYP